MSVCLTRHFAPVICEADSATPLCVRLFVRLFVHLSVRPSVRPSVRTYFSPRLLNCPSVFFSSSLKSSVRLSLKIRDRQNQFVCLYVFLGRRKYGYGRLSVRPSIWTYFSPRLLNGPARGEASTGREINYI